MTIVAIDCDETLIDTMHHISLYAKKHFGFDWLYHDYKQYMIHENNHIDMNYDEAKKFINDYYSSLEAKDALPFE
jgi:hypothetical protein